jgi:hypothetical protein
MDWQYPRDEPHEYSYPMLPSFEHHATSPLPPLVRINAVMHAVVRELIAGLDTKSAILQLTHSVLGRRTATTLQHKVDGRWVPMVVPTRLHSHLATLRARTVIDKTPPWYTATILIKMVSAQSSSDSGGDPFELETTLDLTNRPDLPVVLTRTDYEDDLNIFPRNLTQLPDWFITGLLAPSQATDTTPAKNLIRAAAVSACLDDSDTACAALAAMMDIARVAGPLVLAFATRAVTTGGPPDPNRPGVSSSRLHETTPEPSDQPSPLTGIPSLIATTHPAMRALSTHLLPDLIQDLRDELIYGRDGADLVTRVATTTAMLTACGILYGQPQATVDKLCQQAFADYDLPDNAEYFGTTMSQMRTHHGQLFHAWAITALIVSDQPDDRLLAARHATPVDLGDALDAEENPAVLAAMLDELITRAQNGTDISEATQGINTAVYRLLYQGELSRPNGLFAQLVPTQLLTTNLMNRLSYPPVHDDIRSVVVATGMVAPGASLLAVSSTNPDLRAAAIRSGHLDKETLMHLQLSDPDTLVATQATLALSQRRLAQHTQTPPPHHPRANQD